MKIHEICRTCLSESSDLRSIFKLGVIAGKTTSLSRVLMEFTRLTINDADPFPDKMCYGCVIQANQSFAFLQTCLESDRYLREKLGKTKIIRRTNDNDDGAITEAETQTVYLYNTVNVEGENEIDVHIEPSEVKVIKSDIICSSSQNDEEHIMLTSDDGSEQDQTESDGEIHEMIENDSLVTEILEIRQECDNSNSSFDNIKNEVYYNDITSDEIKVEMKNVEELNFEENVEHMHSIKCESNEEIISDEHKKKRKTRIPSDKMDMPYGPPYVCNICQKRLSTRSSMKYHMQLHSNSTPFLCNECGEGFKTRNAYEGHMTTHDENNPHKCNICGKVYRQSSSLKTHMLKHTGEKPFLCGICGKGMTQKSGFKKHMLVHSGEMPFECDICDKKFRYSSNLIAHKKTHSEKKENTISCEVCKKYVCNTITELKKHIQTHTMPSPYRTIIAECRFCKKRFTKFGALASHIRTNHKNESTKVDIKIGNDKKSIISIG